MFMCLAENARAQIHAFYSGIAYHGSGQGCDCREPIHAGGRQVAFTAFGQHRGIADDGRNPDPPLEHAELSTTVRAGESSSSECPFLIRMTVIGLKENNRAIQHIKLPEFN